MPPRLAIAIVSIVVLLALAPPAGAAVFGPPETHVLGFGPKGLATGDFNHDGDPDLAMTSAAGVQVLLGGPDGTFGAPRLSPAGTLPNASPVVADFNGDGDQDLAVLDPSILHISILLGSTGATFAAPVAYDVLDPGQNVVAGDWDSDGDPDLAVATSAGTVRILVNDGAGSFGAPVAVAVPGNNIALVVGEYSEDGDLDIAVVNSVGVASMLLGRNGASFDVAPVTFPVGGQPAGAAGGDVTGDGRPDLLIGDNSVSGFFITLLRGKGAAGLDTPAPFGAGGPSYGLATADFSADGVDDLVITSGSRLSFMAGGGNDLGAAQHSSTSTNDDAGPIAIADVDGDGRRDVIVLHFAAATVSVQRNVAAPAVTPDAAAATFATQARDTLSAARTVTLRSTGDSALHPRRVQMAGAHADDFVVTGDTCSGELLPKGSSCTLKVRFAPSATGPRQAQLQLISDAAPLSIALSGVGGALPAGPPGKSGSATVRDRLAAAFAIDRVTARAGKRVRMRFVSTMAGVATLELRRGSRVLARVSDAVAAGRNALSMKAPRKRGRYTLALTVTGGGQTVTDSARLTVRRRPT